MKRLPVFVFILIALMAIAQQKTTIVASSYSKKYHLSTCEWGKKINPRNLIKFTSIAKAKEAGYVACKVCKPDTLK